MDKFEQWIDTKKSICDDNGNNLFAYDYYTVQEAWQAATKQRDAQYELMAEHTELSIGEDAIIGERERIMEIIDSESYHAINAQAFMIRVKDRIEKDSN